MQFVFRQVAPGGLLCECKAALVVSLSGGTAVTAAQPGMAAAEGAGLADTAVAWPEMAAAEGAEPKRTAVARKGTVAVVLYLMVGMVKTMVVAEVAEYRRQPG